jgi:hypothetical protein
MRTSFVVLPLVIGSAVWAALQLPTPHNETPPSVAATVEVARIRSHFDSVLTELRTANVKTLDLSQRTNRATLISTLEAYRDRGLFPRNYDFPGQAVSYFVDRNTGVLCAVGHLLETTGRRDIVDRVAAANNNVLVPQLANDAELASWLNEQGITLKEAARIQPQYNYPENPTLTKRDASYDIGSAIAFTAAGGLATWNLMGNRRGRSRAVTFAGLAVGLAASGYGATMFNEANADNGLGALATVAGAASTWLASRSFRQRRADLRAASGKGTSAPARVSLAPLAPVRGRSGSGLMLSVAF